MENQNKLTNAAKALGAKGGRATLKKHGKKFYKKMVRNRRWRPVKAD